MQRLITFQRVDQGINKSLLNDGKTGPTILNDLSDQKGSWFGLRRRFDRNAIQIV